jgi:hypothetical protein
MLTRALPAALVLAALLPVARAVDDSTEIIQFLSSTGADADGTARARWKQDEDSTQFDVELENLPEGSYVLLVDGAAVHDGTIAVDAQGHGEVEYQTPQDGSKPLFDFEVLDKLLEIKQSETVFFSDTFSSTGSGGGGGGGGGDKTKVEVLMVNVGSDVDAAGKLRWEAKSGKQQFKVEVEDLQAGSYQLLVGGTPVSQFEVSGFETEIEFQDPVEPGKLLLNFDPLGQQVDVASGGSVFLTAILPAANGETGTKPPSSGKKGAKDVGKKKGDALQVLLMNTGLLAGAEGKATLKQNGELELEVEIEHVPDGSYALIVDDLPVGTIDVSDGEGQIQYSTSPEAGELLLGFPVKGKLLSVSNDEGVILSVVFPVTAQAALDKFKPEIHKADHVKVNLVSTGTDLDATGLLDWKHKSSHDTFVVSVADLAPGSYDLLVNGLVVNNALVITKTDGKAKMSFDTKPSGKEALLDFVPEGATIKVTPADDNLTVLLQAVVE